MTSLALSSCKTTEIIEKAPITELRVPIITSTACSSEKCIYEGACDIRKIADKTTLSSTRVRVGQLSECNGIWGLTAKEFGELRIYIKNQNTNSADPVLAEMN